MPAEWGYLKSNGPTTWEKVAPAAAGQHQSPINIVPSTAQFEKQLMECPLSISYDSSKARRILNNGHSVQITFNSTGSCLEGGPLANKYQIVQLHFHWGASSATGSEHRIDGKMYPAEIHIVHYNADKYSNFDEAATAEDGLCVLATFIKVGDPHPGFQRITEKLSEVKFKDSSVPMKDGFNPACILPGDVQRYWTYAGSLTTPPCYESVRWIIFKEPIAVSEEQLKALRDLVGFPSNTDIAEDEYNGQIVENYRPPKELGDRTLHVSYE